MKHREARGGFGDGGEQQKEDGDLRSFLVNASLGEEAETSQMTHSDLSSRKKGKERQGSRK